jgi:hypothetical protein
MGHWQDFTCKEDDYSFIQPADEHIGESSNLLIWSGAESTTTIVGASIPFLRVLVKRVTSTKGNSYPLGNTGQRYVNSSRADRQFYKRQHDEHSERSILGKDNGEALKITQTNEVTLTYHERGDEESQYIPAKHLSSDSSMQVYQKGCTKGTWAL